MTLSIICLFISCTGQPNANERIVKQLGKKIVDNYIFLDQGQAMQDTLLRHLKEGDYADLSGISLANALQEHLRDVTNDKHLRIRHKSEPLRRPKKRTISQYEFGIGIAKALSNEIGYLEITGFHNPNAELQNHLAAQMNALAHHENIILDLRNNGGGSPEGVQLLCSYFFEADENIRLNTLHFRNRNVTQNFHVIENLKGTRLEKQQVYILTSNYTFSAGEEFCYNMQQLKRAKIIGETTGGGAHPVNRYNIENGFIAIIPVGRAINPVSKTNWEGVGVIPEIKAEEEKALERALEQINQ